MAVPRGMYPPVLALSRGLVNYLTAHRNFGEIKLTPVTRAVAARRVNSRDVATPTPRYSDAGTTLKRLNRGRMPIWNYRRCTPVLLDRVVSDYRCISVLLVLPATPNATRQQDTGIKGGERRCPAVSFFTEVPRDTTTRRSLPDFSAFDPLQDFPALPPFSSRFFHFSSLLHA